MFWWCCGDFSNLTDIFRNAIGAKAHHEDTTQNNRKGRNAKIQDDEKFASIFTYKPQTYAVNRYGAFDDLDDANQNIYKGLLEKSNGNQTGIFMEYACTALSSVFFLLTLPFSLFFTVKFVGPFERLVVMRLGRTRGVYERGTVLVLPLVDKATCIDLRIKSIELPAIHVMTVDQGMVEVVAIAYTKVIDPLTVCCALQNRDQTLHTLAYTALTRHLSKRLLNDITNQNSLSKILLKCQDEMNEFIRRHGVQVDRLAVNQLREIKPAENAAVSVFQKIAKSDFGKQLMGQLGAHLHATTMASADKTVASTVFEQSKMGRAETTQTFDTITAISNGLTTTVLDKRKQEEQKPPNPSASSTSTGGILTIDSDLYALMGRIRPYLSEQLAKKVGKHYRILCTDANAEIDINLAGPGAGWCEWTGKAASFSLAPDVHFTLTKSTLLALVNGMSPMSAYLNGGLVQIRGSVQDAMALRHLAECVSYPVNPNPVNERGYAQKQCIIEGMATKKSQ